MLSTDFLAVNMPAFQIGKIGKVASFEVTRVKLRSELWSKFRLVGCYIGLRLLTSRKWTIKDFNFKIGWGTKLSLGNWQNYQGFRELFWKYKTSLIIKLEQSRIVLPCSRKCLILSLFFQWVIVQWDIGKYLRRSQRYHFITGWRSSIKDHSLSGEGSWILWWKFYSRDDGVRGIKNCPKLHFIYGRPF